MPRELVALAYALDAVVELPTDVVGWRARLRAVSLREELDELIPRSGGEPWRARIEEPETPLEHPPKADTVEDLVALPPPDVRIDHAPRSERSRARQLAHSIADKDARALAVRAIVAGWTLRRTANGHWMLERGKGETLTFASSGDWRAIKNTRARARRLGIDTEGL